MTLTKLFRSFSLLAVSFLTLLSCSSKDDPQPYNAIGVFEVEASANFDLSARAGWDMYVGNTTVGAFPYTFEVTGNKLSASPSNERKPFKFTTPNDRAVITLVSKDYYTGTRTEMTLPPNFENQSTPDNFMRCDMLKAEYYGDAASELKDITFLHQNALLNFKTVDIPEDAQVYIQQNRKQLITPLRNSEDPTAYKAIVFPDNDPYEIEVVVKLENGQTYKKPLSQRTRMSMPRPDGIGASAVVEFTARMTENGLRIEDLERKPYAKEWPLER